MAAGHDGLLRGAPEPCLVFGVFHVQAGRAVTVGRSLTRLSAPSQFPVELSVQKTLVQARVPSKPFDSEPATFVVLAMGFEEDGGEDLARAYADLEHPERLSVWDERSEVPEPRAIEELGALPPSDAPTAEVVRVLCGGREPASAAASDDFIASLAIRIDARPATRPTEWRFQFRSPDGRNDWTAILLVKLG